MGKVLVERSSLQGVANAIRQKTGGTDILRFKPSEMEQGVLDIPQGIFPSGTMTVTRTDNNQTLDCSEYENVRVQVVPTTEEKTIPSSDVTLGDQLVVEKSSNVDGMTKVKVNVPSPNLCSYPNTAAIFTEDDEYDVPAGYDGYGTIKVNTGAAKILETPTEPFQVAYGQSITVAPSSEDYQGITRATVVATAPTGTITIDEIEGTVNVKDYATANISIPTETLTRTIPYGSTGVVINPTEGKLIKRVSINTTEPEGNKPITSNGNNINVKDYATVSVNVPNGTETLEATQNYHTYTPTGSNIGFSSVSVNVTPNLQDKTIASNGTYTADTDYDGLGTVNVNVPLGTKTINVNGTYSATADDLAGYSSVNVAVQSGMSHASVTTANSWNVQSLTFTFPEGDTDDPNIAWMLIGGNHQAVPSSNSNYYIERIFRYTQEPDQLPNRWWIREDIPGQSGGTTDEMVTVPNNMFLNITKNGNQVTIDFNSTVPTITSNKYFYPNCTYTLYKVSSN